jgi:hypothetical protein
MAKLNPSSGLIDAHPALLLSAYVPKCSTGNSAQYSKCLILSCL